MLAIEEYFLEDYLVYEKGVSDLTGAPTIKMIGFNCPLCQNVISLQNYATWDSIEHQYQGRVQVAVEGNIRYKCYICRADLNVTFYQTIKVVYDTNSINPNVIKPYPAKPKNKKRKMIIQ